MKDATEVSLFDEEQIKKVALRTLKEIREGDLNQYFKVGTNSKVICDETNNTPQDIENGVVNVTVILPPSLIEIDVTPVDQGDE
jgi:hypothetical protein